MILHIDDNKTVSDLRDKFELCYPHLKLEFYNKAHNWQEATHSKYLVEGNCRIGDIRHQHNAGIYEIKSWFQTGKVEQEMKDLFGLNVQIFRQKEDLWIQTTKSDKLTLAQLNDKIGAK